MKILLNGDGMINVHFNRESKFVENEQKWEFEITKQELYTYLFENDLYIGEKLEILDVKNDYNYGVLKIK